MEDQHSQRAGAPEEDIADPLRRWSVITGYENNNAGAYFRNLNYENLCLVDDHSVL